MRKISVSILLVLLSLGAVNAQSVQDAYQQSLEKMRASDWQGGLDILSKFVDLKSNKKEASLRKIGPRFGWFWYHRGFCESKLGKFDEAIQSYKVCYEDYPNDPKKPDSLNSYHTYSLYKWAELAFQKKDYKTAQEQYLKFLKEKRSKDKQANKYNKGKLNVELGICYFKQDDFKNGEKYLEDAVENKAKYLTVPSDVFKGFDALVTRARHLRNNSVF